MTLYLEAGPDPEPAVSNLTMEALRVLVPALVCLLGPPVATPVDPAPERAGRRSRLRRSEPVPPPTRGFSGIRKRR